MDPRYLNVQEADGTKVAFLTATTPLTPYSHQLLQHGSMAGGASAASAILANPERQLPVIDPACAVITSYFRSQPTRVLFPPRSSGCKAPASRTSR